jgi:hypothetical protein
MADYLVEGKEIPEEVSIARVGAGGRARAGEG